MKIRLISSLDGARAGFRAVPDNAALLAFEQTVAPMFAARARLQAAAAQGLLPYDEVLALEARYADVTQAITAHAVAFGEVTTASHLVQWRSRAAELTQGARAYEQAVGRLLGDTRKWGSWKIILWSAGAVAVVGGVAFLVVRQGLK